MTEPLRAAVSVEARKFVAASVVRATSVLLLVGIPLLATSMALAARAGNEEILAQLGPLAAAQGWEQYLGITTQITAAAALLGIGVVVSWAVGREFAEGSIHGLLALPISRATLMASKLVVVVAWTVALAIGLVAIVTTIGIVAAVGAVEVDVAGRLARLLVLVVLSGLLAVPAALAATLGRGLLAGIATTIVTVAAGQVMVVVGIGAWFPVVAPALWASDPGAVSAIQLGLVGAVSLAFGWLAARSWSRLEIDR